ncbi:hypothetical protein HY988_03840 [Candidatus Micrarchaeota archaeon]|nr:hypothetical protein [Candidatus Micrarchaeota archaeon]
MKTAETLKKEFINRILDAEKRVRKGSKISFKSVKQRSAHLKKAKNSET